MVKLSTPITLVGKAVSAKVAEFSSRGPNSIAASILKVAKCVAINHNSFLVPNENMKIHEYNTLVYTVCNIFIIVEDFINSQNT